MQGSRVDNYSGLVDNQDGLVENFGGSGGSEPETGQMSLKLVK